MEENRRRIIEVPMDEEILMVKLFIAQIHTGHYKFVEPDPEELNFDAEQEFRKRVETFAVRAEKWLRLFQSDRDSQEFKELTRDMHSRILKWRSNNLVTGTATIDWLLTERELAIEDNRRLRKEIEKLKEDNLTLSEKIEEFRRPLVAKDSETTEIVGEE